MNKEIEITEEILELAKKERTKYMREWRAKNKDRIAAANQKYWIRKALEAQTRQEAEKES